jgi:hypothetical protein
VPSPPRRASRAAAGELRLIELVAHTPTLLRRTRATGTGRAEPGWAVHAAFRFLTPEVEPLTFWVSPSRQLVSTILACGAAPLARIAGVARDRLAALIAAEGADAARLWPFHLERAREAVVSPPSGGATRAFRPLCAPTRTGRPRGAPVDGDRTAEFDAFLAERRDLRASFDREHFTALDRRAIPQEARSRCYRAWLEERLADVRLRELALGGVRVAAVLRGTSGARKTIGLPVAELSGLLVVEDATLFRAPVIAGIGGHEAYGLGMLRLGPRP